MPAQLSAAAARCYGKLFFLFSRVTEQQTYHTPCPQGTPTRCGASRRNGRDLIIAKNDQRTNPYPHCISGSGARGTSSPLNRQCYPPHFMRECIPPNLHDPQRAKGSLDRRSKWFSLVTFFLQKKKVTRAGARNAPSPARRRNTCLSPRQGSLET